MLCLFALMLLSPVAANASVADQLDVQRDLMAQATETPPEEELAEPTEEPFVEPTEEPVVEPTEEPLVEPTEEPTEEPQGEQLGAIEVEYRECQAGYDIPGTDPDTVLMECGQVDDVLFEVTASDGAPSSQLTGEFGDSHVSFTELPTGQTTIRQADAPGEVYVTCNGIVQNGGPETGDMPLTVNANNTSVQWNLLDDEVAFCNWFVAAGAATGTEVPGTETATEEPTGELVGSFEIEYRECPPNYDIENTDADTILIECSQVDDVEFQVVKSDGGTETQLTGEFGDSHVSFTELPTGMTTVSRLNFTTDSFVACNGIVQNGGPETGEMPLNVINDAVEWNLLDDEIAFCNWFARGGAPDGTEVAGTEIPENEQAGSIYINYQECPQGTDFATITDDGLATDCTGTNNGVVFNAINGPFSETQATGDITDSAVEFANVPIGTVSVKQLTPPQQLIVICEGIVANDGPAVAESRLPITQATIEWNLIDDEEVYCDWYVIPLAPGVGDVVFNKYACPESIDAYSRDYNQLASQCDEDPGTVDVTLTFGSGYATGEASGFGNYAWFPGLPTGSVTMSEALPDGYGTPIVYCKVMSRLDSSNIVPLYQASVGEGPSIVGSLGAEQVLWCDWFNVPGTDNTITVYKWDCPSGTMYDGEMTYYEAECATEHLNIPITLVDANGEHPTTTQANGTQWNNVAIGQEGELQIFEEIPDGYGDPVVYCWSNDGDPVLMESVNGFVVPQPNAEGESFDYYCNWYNIPGDGSTITIIKYVCPEGTGYEEEDDYYGENCTETFADVDFRLTHSEGEVTSTTDGSGEIVWSDVPLGPFSLQEYIPPEYAEPVVICGFSAFYDGAVNDGFPMRVEVSGGYFESELEIPNTDYFCWWYNIPGEPGELTIYKYTCPEGYDLYAWNANPREDCTDATNGITFRMEGDDYESASVTGDAVDGAVSFGGLEPGPYTVVESVLDSTSYVFVFDCYGQSMGELRPYPLWMGNDFPIDVSSGESIECYWYNVPDHDEGRLTVYKYWCSTKTYTSDVDCEIYEGGKDFDLVMWDGDSWEKLDTKTTDGGGMITWGGIDPGEYWLDEHDTDWCHMTSEQLSDDGNWLNVDDGEETIVTIYNCGVDPKDPDNSGKPGTPGKTPTKYPNTGVSPEQGPGAPAELPALAPLAGLLALLATRRSYRFGVAPVATDPIGEAAAPSPVSSRSGNRCSRTKRADTQVGPYDKRVLEAPMTNTLTRRKLAALLTIPLGATALVRSGILAQADQVIEPIDGTPPGGTPTSLCLPATPEADAEADECLRGPVPFQLEIAAIGVAAPVEILETVGGVMQQPSDEAHVAWYKETARLGELGNILVAGHLNWWGVPEAVFFNLGTLREGDAVVLLDEEENAYTYEVEWVRQESNLEPPAEEVLGMTGYEAVTLITCGGQWDSSISEYDERTVARAKRVADAGTPEA